MAPLLDTIEARFDRGRCAVLVIDMQADFCAEDGYVETVVGRSTAACRALVEPLAAFLETARAAGVPVIWVRAIYDHATLPPAILTKQAANGPTVCCAAGSQGAAFYGVAPDAGEAVFDKHDYSAFTDPALARSLRERGISSLVFTGVQTNVCVESSLRDAVCQGFYAAIAEDCVASHAPALHDATLQNVRMLFGDVLPARDITAIWNQTPKGSAAP